MNTDERKLLDIFGFRTMVAHNVQIMFEPKVFSVKIFYALEQHAAMHSVPLINGDFKSDKEVI